MKLNDDSNRNLAKSLGQTEQRLSVQDISCALKTTAILVPVQNTHSCSRKALHYAVQFAKQLNARIILMHVLSHNSAPVYKYDSRAREWYQSWHVVHDAESQLKVAAQVIPEDVPVEIDLQFGTPAVEIVNYAKLRGVNMIVMATHGHRGVMHLLVGSVSARVARLASCPVLVVREHESEFTLDSAYRLAGKKCAAG